MEQSYLLISEFKIFLFEWISANDRIEKRVKNLQFVSWFKVYVIVNYKVKSILASNMQYFIQE